MCMHMYTHAHTHAHAHTSFISTTTKPLPDSAANTDYVTLTMTAFTTTPICNLRPPWADVGLQYLLHRRPWKPVPEWPCTRTRTHRPSPSSLSHSSNIKKINKCTYVQSLRVYVCMCVWHSLPSLYPSIYLSQATANLKNNKKTKKNVHVLILCVCVCVCVPVCTRAHTDCGINRLSLSLSLPPPHPTHNTHAQENKV
jgi:hypothetical protein